MGQPWIVPQGVKNKKSGKTWDPTKKNSKAYNETNNFEVKEDKVGKPTEGRFINPKVKTFE